MSKPDNIPDQPAQSTKAEEPQKPEPKLRKRAAKLPDMDAPRHIEVEPREYDLDVIEEFLDLIFHADMTEKGEPLVWMVPRHRTPVFPISEEEMFDKLERTKKGYALYFGTASCRRNNAGELFNRQSLFERLHVLVLDDIGTKAQPEDLPEALRDPTYIMETSKGNFQYGYVFEAPIDNLDAAKALVKIMYDAGIADAGGKMPNKLVRLPEGINGKKGPKCNFVTSLVTMDGPLWSPQALLDAVDAGATWDEILADGEEAVKRRARLKGGTTPWAPYRPKLEGITGIIDPVAEWLETEEQIVQDGDEWMTVQCPWADEHTSGGTTAGYKPLGRGEDPLRRVFHCFHDSCKDHDTRSYLQFVANAQGPSAAPREEAAGMVHDFVYDMFNDCAWRINDTPNPLPISMNGMRNAHPRSTLVAVMDGKIKTVTEYQQWLTSESRVTVMGPTFDPSNPARIVKRGNDLFVNQYAPPDWGKGRIDMEHVERFTNFVKYLIPTESEREYFLDWLAAKLQDMGFRGAAIVMVAQRQGVGRSTLGDMMATLMGEANVRNEPFDKIVGEKGGDFNDWLEAPMVISDESLNTGGLNSYKTYEKLKELIDPRPKLMTINPKYGKQRRCMVHSSFMFLSNHSNALSITPDDRRFYVITNPFKPAPEAYFTEINDWLKTFGNDGKPVWAASVYRWLLQRDVNLERLLAPPEATAGKLTMIEEARNELDVAIDAIMVNWPCEYISAPMVSDALEAFADRIGLYDLTNYRAQIKRVVNSMTYPLHTSGGVVKIEGSVCRLRVLLSRAGDDTPPKGEKMTKDQRQRAQIALAPVNIKKAYEDIAKALEIAGL